MNYGNGNNEGKGIMQFVVLSHHGPVLEQTTIYYYKRHFIGPKKCTQGLKQKALQ